MQKQLNVALIAAPYPLEEAPSPPLGICYVAAQCEAIGANVCIWDYIISRYSSQKLCAAMDQFRPNMIGISAVTMNFLTAVSILKDAKKHDPSVITVMGGPHATFDYDNILTLYPEVDLIVRGESEETLKELLPSLNDKKKWHSIKGLAFRNNDTIGQKPTIVVTQDRDLIQDLDSLPLPARHLLPLSRYQGLGFPVSMITSRGCPNKCIFCLGRRMVGSHVRYRSHTSIVDEIEQILSYGLNWINIADDLFTSNLQRVKTVCDEILRRGLKFTWSAFSRVNTVDLETLQVMKKAGCYAVSFGIESGNQEMLDRVKKGITLEQAKRAVGYCKQAEMVTHASFMVGLPGETMKTLQETRDFAKSLQIEFGYHFFSPFPGTTVKERINEYDVEIVTDDWNRYDANSAIVRTSSLSPQDIDDFVAKEYEGYKTHWKNIKEQYENGTCSQKDYFDVDEYYRREFIYKVLSEDLIEAEGRFKADESNPPLNNLVKKLAQTVNMKEDFISRHLNRMVSAGYIDYKTEENNIIWFWTHNNRVRHAGF